MKNDTSLQDTNCAMKLFAFKITIILLYSLNIILQILGITFLNKDTKGNRHCCWQSSQRIILKNISCCHIFFSFIQIHEISVQLISYKETIVHKLLSTFLRGIMATSYPLYMHYISIDRFFQVYYSLKYPIIFKRRLVVGIAAGIWGFSCVFGSCLTFLQYTARFQTDSTTKFTFTAVSGSVLISFGFVYGYLYFKWRSLHSASNRKNGQFLMPVLIVVSFLLFEMVGTVLTVIHDNANLMSINRCGLRLTALALFALVGMSDVAVYIILIRSNVRRKNSREKKNMKSMKSSVRTGSVSGSLNSGKRITVSGEVNNS